jgi:hypothetical protein
MQRISLRILTTDSQFLPLLLNTFLMHNFRFSWAVLGSCLLTSGLLGCRHESDPTPSAEPFRAQFHIDYQKIGTSAPGYFTMSSKPLRHASEQADRLHAVVLKQPATGVLDFDFASQALPDTLYVSFSPQVQRMPCKLP